MADKEVWHIQAGSCVLDDQSSKPMAWRRSPPTSKARHARKQPAQRPSSGPLTVDGVGGGLRLQPHFDSVFTVAEGGRRSVVSSKI